MADWIKAVTTKRDENVAKMAPRLMNNNVPMDYHGALGVLRTIIKERPDAILVNEGANTLDLARGIIDIYQPRKRIDVGTWGIMGIGMGYAIAAAIETGKPVLCVEGDSAFGFSGMEVETICRYNLPVCIVIFNNDGIYRGTDVNTRQRRSRADRVREGLALRQDDRGFRRRRRERDHRPTSSSAPSTKRWTAASRPSSTRCSIRRPAASPAASAISIRRAS